MIDSVKVMGYVYDASLTLRMTFSLDIPSDASPLLQIQIGDDHPKGIPCSVGGLARRVRSCLLVAVSSRADALSGMIQRGCGVFPTGHHRPLHRWSGSRTRKSRCLDAIPGEATGSRSTRCLPWTTTELFLACVSVPPSSSGHPFSGPGFRAPVLSSTRGEVPTWPFHVEHACSKKEEFASVDHW